jgi:hypothetical protein
LEVQKSNPPPIYLNERRQWTCPKVNPFAR